MSFIEIIVAVVVVFGGLGAVWALLSVAFGYEAWRDHRVVRPEWTLGLVATFILAIVLSAFGIA